MFLRFLSYRPLFFLLFINELLNLTQCPIHFYADDTILHFLTAYNRRPTQYELSDSRRDAIGRLTSDLSLVSKNLNWQLCPIVSASLFLSLQAACSVQEPYPSMYGVWFSCLGGSTHTALLNRVESKTFCLINCPPLTDCLDSLSQRRNVASLSFLPLFSWWLLFWIC